MIFSGTSTPDGATPLNEDEKQDLIPTHIVTQSQLNEWEQANILAAEGWLFARKRRNLLTESFLRTLHRRMFSATWKMAGTNRSTGTNIGVPASQVSTSVRDICDDVVLWLREAVFPVDEIAIRLHHRLVFIHPFANGNGRHTRLMADAVLFNADAPLFTWGLHDLQSTGTSRPMYLEALREADRGDISRLLKFARS